MGLLCCVWTEIDHFLNSKFKIRSFKISANFFELRALGTGDRPSGSQKSLIQKSKVQKRYKPLDCRASLATLRDLFMENEKYVFRDA